MELVEIKNLLLSDRLNYKQAFEEIHKLPDSWTTKEWKEKRQIYLKDKCENCGSSKPPLVIQHTKHPTFPYYSVLNEMFKEELREIKIKAESLAKRNIEDYLILNSEEREACPICHKISLRKRKNMFPQYVCSRNHKFETPVIDVYYIKCQTTDYKNAKLQTIHFLIDSYINKERKKLKQQYDLIIGKQAFLKYLDERFEYLDFKYIKTCCKSCAAKEDWHFIMVGLIE